MIITALILHMFKILLGLALIVAFIPSGICIGIEWIIYSLALRPLSERHPVAAKIIMTVLSAPTALVIICTLMCIIDEIKDIIK